MITLRAYQQKGVVDLRAVYAACHRRVLYRAPTGSGKTVLFAHIVHAATARGHRVVIVGHCREITEQVSDVPLRARHCTECGTVLHEPVQVRVEIQTRLVRAERLAAMTYRQALAWAGRNEARLRLVARARGYKRGWIYHVRREGDAA